MADIKSTITVGNINSNISVNSQQLNGATTYPSNIEGNVSTSSNSNVELSPAQNLTAETTGNTRNVLTDSNISTQLGLERGYVHIKYCHTRPTSDSDMLWAPDSNTYFMGVYTNNDPAPSTRYTDYQWFQIRGVDGEQGEQGEKGDKGDTGNALVTIVNPLYFTGYLNPGQWIVNYTGRNDTYYSQKIEITDITLETSTLTQQELIDYLNLKMTDNCTPIIDLLVSDDVILGKKQIENWKYLTRAYITKDELDTGEIWYYINFECYQQPPTVQLHYQVKVI